MTKIKNRLHIETILQYLFDQEKEKFNYLLETPGNSVK